MEQAVEGTTAEPESALRRAAIAGDVATLHRLLYAGIPIDATDPNGWTALMLAAKYGRMEAVAYLVKCGAEVNQRNSFSSTPLHWAVYRSHADIVRFLINRGADVNERYGGGITPLMAAVDSLEILRVLVLAGADVNAADDSDSTALSHATLSGNAECALCLLENGAIIRLCRNGPKSDRSNPLTWAKLRKQDELARRLEAAVVYDDAETPPAETMSRADE
jgi:uncharacterized protein